MSEPNNDCDRFDGWLLAGATELESAGWRDHMDGCDECRRQWEAHRLLVAAFADEAVPELSPAFQAGLERKLAPAVEIRPLRGWRRSAMVAYAAAAAGLLAWLLRDVPLPRIDPAAPWLLVAALTAVPLTFVLAIAASRLIPGRGLPGTLRVL